MSIQIRCNTPEDNRFETIIDFKWCMNHGGEVAFEWKGKAFGIWTKLKKTPNSPMQMCVSQVRIENMAETERWCDTADEVLEYTIDGKRLRNIITHTRLIPPL